MKKLKLVLLALFMLAVTSPSFASVGVKKDGILYSTATDLNFLGIGNSISTDGSTVTFNLVSAGVTNGGASQMASGVTAVPTAYAVVNKFITSTAQTGSLANGTPGQILTINIVGVTSSGTFYLVPTTTTGFVSLLFNALDDEATLLYVNDTVGWILLSQTSVTVGH